MSLDLEREEFARLADKRHRRHASTPAPSAHGFAFIVEGVRRIGRKLVAEEFDLQDRTSPTLITPIETSPSFPEQWDRCVISGITPQEAYFANSLYGFSLTLTTDPQTGRATIEIIQDDNTTADDIDRVRDRLAIFLRDTPNATRIHIQFFDDAPGNVMDDR